MRSDQTLVFQVVLEDVEVVWQVDELLKGTNKQMHFSMFRNSFPSLGSPKEFCYSKQNGLNQI